MNMLFPLGRVVATPDALDTLLALGIPPISLIRRHVSGDWSDMGREDQQSNREAVRDGLRVFSAYDLPNGVRIWIITEADRSSTTILLPEDY